MRLVSYRSERGDRAGALTDEGVTDAADALGEEVATVRGLLGDDRVGELRERLSASGSSPPASGEDEVELLPPVPDPKVDYEAEVAVVIGRRSKEVAPGDAASAIGGHMLLNDLSARDLQFATPHLVHARSQRRAHAGGLHLRPDLLDPGARLASLALDDA